MVSARADATLRHLRNALSTLEKDRVFLENPGTLPLGLPAVDTALGGGLQRGALHELAPAAPAHLSAASGFALALAALATARGRAVLAIQTDFGARETGTLYGPGLDLLGLPMERLILLRVPRPIDALWAFEEALKSRGVAIVIAELPEAGAAADLIATQRLTLAARAGDGLGLLLRQRASPMTTAAMTRWQVAAAPSVPDRFGGLGRTAFDLTLNRNKRGRCGRFVVCWDHHEHIFRPQAHFVGVAAPAAHGPAQPQQRAYAG